MAPVRFEAFVDPERQSLIGEDAVAGVLRPNQIRAQASGYPSVTSSQQYWKGYWKRARRSGLALARWTGEELRAMVADYFSMLEDELAGRPYSKTERRSLCARLCSARREPSNENTRTLVPSCKS